MAQGKKRKKGKAVDSWKAKRWYKVKAPKGFEGKEIGEALSSDPALLIGRIVKTTLREITGNIPHQNIQLKFKITNVKGETAETAPVGFELSRGYVGRQTRRMRTLITAIADATTKDGYKVRLKATSFGHGKTRLMQQKEIRKIMGEMAMSLASKKPFEKLLQDIIYGKVGPEIFKPVKKIYPVSKTEIVKCTVLSAPSKK